jgi:alanine-glyoxylate transaminase/serine-glyoxylate transaminase/serine-pyruvate transaminase
VSEGIFTGERQTSPRLLLGPGPSNVHPRVQRAMAMPLVGYLDPELFAIMDDIQAMLRSVYGTANRLTFPVSGTGTAGMEACFANVLGPADRALIGVNGYFGERMAEIARRCGAEVVTVAAEWGRIIEPEVLAAALEANPGVKVVGLVHGETSTGVLQPVDAVAPLVKELGALLILDCVTTLGAYEVAIDGRQVDLAYSCTQKGLACPPGLSPVTVGDGALEALKASDRRAGFYEDFALLEAYWNGGAGPRTYHHTVPVLNLYALREALRLILEEGLPARAARHQRNADALRAGLEAMGLALHAQPGHRLNTLTTVRVPDGVDEARLRAELLNEFSIEIGGGLGPLRGRVLRVGLMGEGSTQQNVLLLLTLLERLLARQGFRGERGAAVAAAQAVLQGG